MIGSNVSDGYALFGEAASYQELWPAPVTVVNVSHQWQSSGKRLCSSGLANATAAKMEWYLTGYPGPGIGERYMWFCAADDGPILPEGVPGPMPGPAPGTGGPGPIAPPPPPVGAVWKPPLAAISCVWMSPPVEARSYRENRVLVGADGPLAAPAVCWRWVSNWSWIIRSSLKK